MIKTVTKRKPLTDLISYLSEVCRECLMQGSHQLLERKEEETKEKGEKGERRKKLLMSKNDV